MSVHSSELAPPAPSPASECVLHPETKVGWQHFSLAGEGRGEPIRTTGGKFGTLSTLCIEPFVAFVLVVVMLKACTYKCTVDVQIQYVWI